MRPLNWSASVLKQSADGGAVLGERSTSAARPSRGRAPATGRRSTGEGSASTSRSSSAVDADRLVARPRRRPGEMRPSATPVRIAPISSSVRDLLALEVLLDERVVLLGHHVDEVLARRLGRVGEVVRDRAGGAGRRAVGVGRRGHRDQVDDARGSRPRCRSGSGSPPRPGASSREGRHRRRRSRRARGRACSRRSPARRPASAAAVPEALGLDLDAGGGVDDHQHRVDRPQGGEGVALEGGLARACRPGSPSRRSR